jgi:hypothetical protein
MTANTWTLQLAHFSQYVVGDDAATLIPGKGFKQLYAAEGGNMPYSILANVVLTY